MGFARQTSPRGTASPPHHGMDRDERLPCSDRDRLRLRAKGFADVRVWPHEFMHPATPLRLIPSVQSLSYILEKLPVLREIAGSLLIFARKP